MPRGNPGIGRPRKTQDPEPAKVPGACWIQLTRGRWTLIDCEDAEQISQWAWHFTGNYARRDVRIGGSKMRVYLHRELLLTTDDVDHINGDTLDNRKQNLRPATPSENASNRGPQINGSSGFKGVTWHKQNLKWMAQINFSNKHHYVGTFDTAEDAARAYDKAARALHGKFAHLNFPRES